MFGRLVLPINFYVEGKDVLVTAIPELKKFYNNNHILELIRALRSERLEQFFYGNGKDDIHDLIVELKKKKVEDAEILNNVAEKIGCERLNEKLVRKIIRFETLSFVELLKGDDETVEFTRDEMNVEPFDLKISRNKTLKSFRETKTKIKISPSTIESLNKNAITFKNLELTSFDKNYQSNLRIKNCKLKFEDIVFSNFELNLENVNANFINCKFIKGKINLKSCDVHVNNCDIEADIETIQSKILIDNSKIKESKGLHIKESIFTLKETEVSECGISNGAQVTVIKSKGEIFDSKICKGVAGSSGLSIEKSEIKLERVEVFEHKGIGINIGQDSIFQIEKSKIHSNGDEIEDCSQIKITNSKGELVDTEVFNGFRSSGIRAIESYIKILKVKISHNEQNGIVIRKSSDFSILYSNVFSNGTEGKSYPQVWIEDSKGEISNTEVYDSVDAMGIWLKGSEVSLFRVITRNNKRNGIGIKDCLSFSLSSSQIFSNGDSGEGYAQIWIEKSKGEVDNTSVYCNPKGIGIWLGNSEINISKTSVYENRANGIVIKNSPHFQIINSEIYSNGTKGENYPQIRVEDSVGEIKNTVVSDSVDAVGIWLHGSEVSMLNIRLNNNKGNGVVIEDFSKFIIYESEIHSNGDIGEGYPQIYIENSKGEIKKTSIHGSLKSTGIMFLNSEVYIFDTSIYENKANGIHIINSPHFQITNSKIYSNGSDGNNYPQIFVENSRGEISNTNVYACVDSVGMFLTGSAVTILKVKLFNNKKYGIHTKNSIIQVFDSEIYNNGTSGASFSQILLENSKGEIHRSSIFKGTAGGVSCHQNSSLKIIHSQIYENKDYGILSDKSHVTLSHTKTWGNKVGIKADQKNVSYDNTCEIKDRREDLSLCFITTAVIRALGQDDNCSELNAFRNFRDNYLRKQEDGELLISEYYKIAPEIVNAIESCDNKEVIYSELWHNYLKPCLNMIREGDLEEVKYHYIEMIETLKSRFLFK